MRMDDDDATAEGPSKPTNRESVAPRTDEVERDVRTIAAFAAVNALYGTLAEEFPVL